MTTEQSIDSEPILDPDFYAPNGYPHEALGWMTPAEKRAQNLGAEVNLAA